MTKSKTYILWIVIAVLVVLALVFILYPKNTNEDMELQTKTLTLSKDNFIILEKRFMNTFQESSCQKARAGDCSWISSNPKTCDTDFYLITFKFANFPSEVDTSSLTEINNNLKVTGYTNGEQVGIKSYDINGQYTRTQYNLGFTYVDNPQTPFVNFPLKYTQDNNLVICFQINGTTFYHDNEPNAKASKIISNEVCLDAIKIDASC